MANHKLALVLSGGGMGGAAHLGAIKAIEEYNLHPNAVLGTSIGAFVGSVYASGATPDMMIAGWQKISRMKMTDVLDLDFQSFKRALVNLDYRHVTGFLLGQVLTEMLTENYVQVQSFPELARLSTEERRQKRVKEFYAISTSLMDGVETVFCDSQTVPLDEDGLFEGRRLCSHVSFVDAVRASFSLPAVFVPHRIAVPTDGEPCPCRHGLRPNQPPWHLYVDGSVKDDYPITIAAKLARADKIIGINLTKAGAKASMVLHGGLPEIQGRVIKIIGDDQYEADRADKDVARIDLATIDPAIGDVGVFDLSIGNWLIERGYQAVRQYFDSLGLQPDASSEENLALLFPPTLVDRCPQCHQVLAEPLDVGSDDLFVADLPPLAAPDGQDKPATGSLKGRLVQLLGRRWLVAILALLLLVAIGGLQIWWVQQQPDTLLSIVIGSVMFAASVLIAGALIGVWLSVWLKNTIASRKFKD